MAEQVTCPQCGKRYAVDQAKAGRMVRCRKCNATFSLGAAPELELAAAPAVADRPPTASPTPGRAAPIPPEAAAMAPSLRWVDWILGPRDAGFWLFLIVLAGGIAAMFAGGSGMAIFSGCTLWVLAVVYCSVGMIWGARLLNERGMSPMQMGLIIAGFVIAAPVLLIVLLTIMLTDPITFRRPLYCLLRGLMLVARWLLWRWRPTG